MIDMVCRTLYSLTCPSLLTLPLENLPGPVSTRTDSTKTTRPWTLDSTSITTIVASRRSRPRPWENRRFLPSARRRTGGVAKTGTRPRRHPPPPSIVNTTTVMCVVTPSIIAHRIKTAVFTPIETIIITGDPPPSPFPLSAGRLITATVLSSPRQRANPPPFPVKRLRATASMKSMGAHCHGRARRTAGPATRRVRCPCPAPRRPTSTPASSCRTRTAGVRASVAAPSTLAKR